MANIIIHHFFDVIKKVPQFLLRSANQKLHSGSPSSIGGLDVGAVPSLVELQRGLRWENYTSKQNTCTYFDPGRRNARL